MGVMMLGCAGDGDRVPIHSLTPKEFMAVTTGEGKSPDTEGGPSFRIMEQPLVAAVTVADVEAEADPDKRKATAGMIMTVTVDEDASLNRQYVIPTTGVIEFPPVGRFPVEGLTAEQISKQIEKALEKDYFQSATVRCALATQAAGGGGGVIYVMGSVGRQGPLLLPKNDRFTVMRAILAVGGCGQFGNCGKVRVIRYGPDGKKYETRINVERIMKTAEFEKDMEVRDGDWLLVPEKWFNF